jgi:hypothetical protein
LNGDLIGHLSDAKVPRSIWTKPPDRLFPASYCDVLSYHRRLSCA